MAFIPSYHRKILSQAIVSWGLSGYWCHLVIRLGLPKLLLWLTGQELVSRLPAAREERGPKTVTRSCLQTHWSEHLTEMTVLRGHPQEMKPFSKLTVCQVEQPVPFMSSGNISTCVPCGLGHPQQVRTVSHMEMTTYVLGSPACTQSAF